MAALLQVTSDLPQRTNVGHKIQRDILRIPGHDEIGRKYTLGFQIIYNLNLNTL